MIDLLATLEPRHGVARAYRIVPPDPPADLLWRTLVVLGDRAGADDRPGDPPPVLSRRVVGAYGGSRADCLPRAVGEAVERFALLPPGPGAAGPASRWGTAAELPAGDRVLDAAAPGVALGHPAARTARLRWYRGQRLAGGEAVWVPAALVDDPADPANGPAGCFDPGPSGAAAGPDRDRAVTGALLEVVERDAFMVAWARQLRLARLPPGWPGAPGVTPGAARGPARRLADLRARIGATGARLVLAVLPTGIGAVRAVVAVVLDADAAGPVAAVGVKAALDAPAAAVGAVHEALQIRSALLGGRAALARRPEVAVPATDEDRLRWLAGPAGPGAVRDWVDGFRDPDGSGPAAGASGPAADAAAADRVQVPLIDRASVPPVDSSVDSSVVRTADASRDRAARPDPAPGTGRDGPDLVAAMVADGGDPILVDLTPRLPGSLQSMGWSAVKVIPVGYQHLRIDERCTHSWNGPRLASATARTGVPAGTAWPPPGGPTAVPPHPLP